MSGRRDFLKTLFGGAAATAAGGPLSAALSIAPKVATAAASALAAGLPAIDVVRRLIKEESSWYFQEPVVEALADRIFKVTKVAKKGTITLASAPRPGEVAEKVYHLDSLVYGKNYVKSMLGDPVGRPIAIGEVLSQKYSPSMCGEDHRYVASALEGLRDVHDALLADGRGVEARVITHALRASQIASDMSKRLAGAYKSRVTYPPQSLDKDYKLYHLVSSGLPLRDLPRAAMEYARKAKALAIRVESYVPRNKDKGWIDEYRANYRQVRSAQISDLKWSEFKWFNEILLQRRRYSRWTARYKERRRPFFERLLANHLRIRKVVFDAMVEHAAAGRTFEAELCLGVVKRLDVLATVPREALEMPPDIGPGDVAIGMLKVFMRKYLDSRLYEHEVRDIAPEWILKLDELVSKLKGGK